MVSDQDIAAVSYCYIRGDDMLNLCNDRDEQYAYFCTPSEWQHRTCMHSFRIVMEVPHIC